MAAEALCDRLFADDVFDGELQHPSDADDFLGILEAWEDCVTPRGEAVLSSLSSAGDSSATPKSAAVANGNNKKRRYYDGDDGVVVPLEPAKIRTRCSSPVAAANKMAGAEGAAKTTTTTSHIAVERNRRKQMNEHLAVLRSLMPCFYVKRGDQASIIGGVVDYIKELQQLLQSLEAKKQRKAYYTDQVIISPRPPQACCSSPRPPLSPRPPIKQSTPLIMSPRRPAAVVPISPRTPPTPSSPYKLCSRQLSLPFSSALPPPLPLPPPPPGVSAYASPAMTPMIQESQSSAVAAPSLDAIAAELCSAYDAAAAAANNKPPAAAAAAAGGAVVLPEVKVEFSGANLVVRTVSHRAPGQAAKVIAALEGRALEILQAKIGTVDDTAVNSFTIKIGIECDLSAEELAQEIQQAFS